MQNKTFKSLRSPLILKKYVLEVSWAHFDCHLQEGNLGRFNHLGSTEQNSPMSNQLGHGRITQIPSEHFH